MKKTKSIKKSDHVIKSESKSKSPPPKVFSIVAIGASAGGLEAISELLKHLPSDLGMAYVIIQHLDPDHDSILPELLEKKTTMPVQKVENNMHVEINQVYVIPPNTFMSIVDSKLKLMNRVKSEGVYHSIDYFLTSLAPIYKNNAIGIILSGTATDGTLGVKAIKAEGGITFAQDNTAKYQGMPRNAADAGYVDFVMSPEKIADELVEISRHPFRTVAPDKQPESDQEIRRILVILHTKLGVDFSYYKDSTVYRRIARRMLLNRCKTLKGYTQYLRKNEEEAHLLYKDLLINVTSFFRDPSFYHALSKEILPVIIKGRKHSNPVRIWVPGCSTGEEACSIAICLIEYFNEKSINIPIQLFATDLSETSIEQARTGIYLKSALENMSRQRIDRFFTPVNGGYQVAKFIRNICVFAPHNILKDPPFSHLDIISCHNVLIYLEPAAQKEIVHAFHYGLNSGGYLLLGKSETIGSADDLFELVDQENKIYSKKPGTREANFDFSTRVPYLDRTKSDRNKSPEMENKIDVEKEADKVLSDYVPPSLLINTDLHIIGFRGDTSTYLRPAAGKASLHLLKMIREEFVFELRTIINRAKKTGQKIKKEKIIYNAEGHTHEVTIEVVPINVSAREICHLIIFKEDASAVSLEKTIIRKGKSKNGKDRQIAGLEGQLKEARGQIKSISEEFESTREELQSANEEVLSSNEELQSMNEELETSQEELQSTNEELTTINDELQLRNTELKEATAYSDAIIRTMREPLIILNQDLRISTANQAFYKLFQNLSTEIEGKFFYEIQNRLWDMPDFRALLSEMNSKDKKINDYKIQKVFPVIGERVMLLNANEMSQEGKTAKILISIEDVTAQMNLENQKDDFISIASHELKTPITALKMYAQLIHQNFIEQGDTESVKLASRMEAQVNKLILLIENLLDLTKITKGVLSYDENYFDLNKLIEETVAMMQATASQHQLATKLLPIDNIWGDKNRIEQVLINLISNAIKYSPEADKVIIYTKVTRNKVAVCIQDFGIGISRDVQQSIFKRFVRTDATKATFSGIGLGLYISNEIITRHGGEFSVKSTLGKGSEFCFILPLKKKGKGDVTTGS